MNDELKNNPIQKILYHNNDDTDYYGNKEWKDLFTDKVEKIENYFNNGWKVTHIQYSNAYAGTNYNTYLKDQTILIFEKI